MKKEETPDLTQDSKRLKMVRADYKAMYEKAKAKGTLSRPTYRIHTWTEDSAVIVGRVKAITLFTEGKFEQEANAYMIETDEGAVSCVLGSYTDAQIKETVKVGSIIAILYQGQKQLEDSRKVNVFDVDIINQPEDKADADK